MVWPKTHIVEISHKITMNKRAKSNTIRLIAGQWRGRKLAVLDAEGLRPTADRVRETLFNWLMYEVPGARCLDLFAGTGALGLESISRGAQFVQFVETSVPVADAIKLNLKTLNASVDQAQVSTLPAQRFLSKPPGEPFDIVFLDPPFASSELQPALEKLVRHGWLSDKALIYIEEPKHQAAVEVPAQWHIKREGKTSQSCFRLCSLNEP